MESHCRIQTERSAATARVEPDPSCPCCKSPVLEVSALGFRVSGKVSSRIQRNSATTSSLLALRAEQHLKMNRSCSWRVHGWLCPFDVFNIERLGAALRFVPWDFCCWRGLSLGGHLRRSYHLQVCKESQGMLETVARSQPMALSTPSAQPALLLPPGCEARRGGRRSAESGFLDVCRNAARTRAGGGGGRGRGASK